MKRKKKCSPSSAKQQKMNEKYSTRNMGRTINCNYGPEDLFVRLSYEKEPEDFDAAEKEFYLYTRRINYYLKKNGLPPLKYMFVTENENEDGEPVRIHHHVLMQKMDWDVVERLWKNGQVHIEPLDASGDYIGIARYLTKTKRRAFKKRWSQSQNLKRPVVEYQVLKRSPDILKAPKGYRTITSQTYVASDETGMTKYLRAVRLPGKGGNRSEKSGSG